MNSSPTPDNSGKRDVFSVYAEFLVPLVSEDMNISFDKVPKFTNCWVDMKISQM